MQATVKQNELLKKLTKELESLCDQDGHTKEDKLEMDCLETTIAVFEDLHYPITEREKRYSKIINELFYKLK